MYLWGRFKMRSILKSLFFEFKQLLDKWYIISWHPTANPESMNPDFPPKIWHLFLLKKDFLENQNKQKNPILKQ